MKKFKMEDKVWHTVYGYGKVTEVDKNGVAFEFPEMIIYTDKETGYSGVVHACQVLKIDENKFLIDTSIKVGRPKKLNKEHVFNPFDEVLCEHERGWERNYYMFTHEGIYYCTNDDYRDLTKWKNIIPYKGNEEALKYVQL